MHSMALALPLVRTFHSLQIEQQRAVLFHTSASSARALRSPSKGLGACRRKRIPALACSEQPEAIPDDSAEFLRRVRFRSFPLVF
jgi:hypothetical protein